MEPTCPHGIAVLTYNEFFIGQTCSVNMAEYWPSSSFLIGNVSWNSIVLLFGMDLSADIIWMNKLEQTRTHKFTVDYRSTKSLSKVSKHWKTEYFFGELTKTNPLKTGTSSQSSYNSLFRLLHASSHVTNQTMEVLPVTLKHGALMHSLNTLTRKTNSHINISSFFC